MSGTPADRRRKGDYGRRQPPMGLPEEEGSNDISNIVPSCKSCNLRKGRKTDREFLGLK